MFVNTTSAMKNLKSYLQTASYLNKYKIEIQISMTKQTASAKLATMHAKPFREINKKDYESLLSKRQFQRNICSNPRRNVFEKRKYHFFTNSLLQPDNHQR